MVRVTSRSGGRLLEDFSELLESVESLRECVGSVRCRESSSFSETRTAKSGSNHYYRQQVSVTCSWSSYLGRPYAIFIACCAVADMG